MAAPKDGSRPTSPGSTLSTCTLHGWVPPRFPSVEDSASTVGMNTESCNAPSSRITAASRPRYLFGRWKPDRPSVVLAAAREVFYLFSFLTSRVLWVGGCSTGGVMCAPLATKAFLKVSPCPFSNWNMAP